MYSLVVIDKTQKLLLEEVKYCPQKDAHLQFMLRLLELENDLRRLVYRNLPMEKLTPERRKELYANKNCSHCHKPLSNTYNGPPCIDHDHFTSEVCSHYYIYIICIYFNHIVNFHIS